MDLPNADGAALNEESKVLQLLNSGPLDQKEMIKRLRAAAAAGQVATLRVLLAAPVINTSKKCISFQPRALAALEAACDCGHADCVTAVLEHGWHDMTAGHCNAAVRNAIRGNHVACLRVLLNGLGPLVKPRHAADYFVSASAEGSVTCMEELQRRGVDPRTVRRRHETPLLAVCRASKHLAAAEWLCRAGVDVDTPDGEGVTPLMLACSARSPDFVALLLRFGANPGRGPGGSKKAPLCRILDAPFGDLWRGESLRCVSLLLDHGASGHAFLPTGNTILHRTICDAPPAGAGNFILPRLLAAGALVKPYNGYDSPLIAAASEGWAFAVRMLCALVGAGGVQQALSAKRSDFTNALKRHVAYAKYFEANDDFYGISPVDNSIACVDELIERGASMPLDLEYSCNRIYEWCEPARAAAVCGLLLARVPLHESLPGRLGPTANEVLLPQALEFARQRLVMLRGGRDGASGAQRELIAAFLHRVRDACGGAVARAFAPFARFRFVAAGGLQQAWAWEREVHRFPVERVTLCRVALQVALEAELVAAVRSVPLLRDAVSAAAAASRWRWQ